MAAGRRRANESLSRVEQIKRHAVLPEEWLPGGDELTPTMKLKRKPIAEKYSPQIEAMYAGDATDDLLAAGGRRRHGPGRPVPRGVRRGGERTRDLHRQLGDAAGARRMSNTADQRSGLAPSGTGSVSRVAASP